MSEQPENQQTASIAAAFPTVAPAALDRLLGSLSSRDDVARLQSEPGSRAQYAKLAAALCASRRLAAFTGKGAPRDGPCV